MAEGGFNFKAQLTGSFLGAVEGHTVGDAHAVGVMRHMAFGRQLFIHLWAKAMHQHNAHAHALDKRQVLRQIGQLASGNGLARDTDHKGLAAVHVDVGCDRAEPRHKGEVKNGGHVGW